MVAFSPDSKKVATASEDKTTKVWDILTGKPIHTLHLPGEAPTSIAFSPDGTRLAAGTKNQIVIWQLAD